MKEGAIQAALKAEQDVIGCVLLDNSALDAIMGIVSQGDFYAEYNREIFGAMLSLSENGEPVNIATLLGKLSGAAYFNANGGVTILTRAMEGLPTAACAETHAMNVVKYASMRKLEAIGESIRENASGNYDFYEYVSKVRGEIDSISAQRKSTWMGLGEAINRAMSSMEEDASRVKSGFSDLDAKLSGFDGGTLTIIAARPAMGKTALALNIMAHAAFSEKVPAAFFSLEMTAEELARRVMSFSAGIPGQFLKDGKITAPEYRKILDFWESNGTKENTRIFIDETPAIDISMLRDRAKRMRLELGVGIIFVDYIQLARSERRKFQTREQEVADISKCLKALAKELHIPVIALSQLNRAVDARAEKRPVLSDLRESGSIEQDADNILFIHREDYYRPNAEQDNIAEIIIAKNRSGSTGVAKLRWDGKYTKFETLEDKF